MGVGKKYSAGAIYLQVLPAFANFQREIQDQVNDIDRALGDEMEKSGDRAGTRAGKAASKSMNEELKKGSREISADMEREFQESVKGMNKALDGVDTRNLGKKMRAEMKQMKADLDDLGRTDIHIDDNLDSVGARVAAVRSQIEEMRKRSKVFFDIKGLPQAYRNLAQLETAIKSIDGKINLDVDTDSAARKMGSFERSIKQSMNKAASHIDGSVNKSVRRLRDELDYLSKLRVNIDIGATQLKREVGEIMAELEALSSMDPEIDVRFEAGKAFAEIGAWMALVEHADGQDVDVDVKVHGAARAAGELGAVAASSRSASGAGDNASNSFRSFNIIMLAATSIGPALIPILGAMTVGLLAIGPAAAVAAGGLTAVVIGFSGIGDAVKALQAKQDQAATATQSAAKVEVSSANQVANARRSAARAVESALGSQKDAQERYADSIKDVKDAQDRYAESVENVRDAEQALRDAREAAKGTGADLDRQIQGNSLAIDQALLNSFDATVTFNSVMGDGSATNAEKEQARIDREEALLRLEELRAEQKELAQEKKKWDREGVNGTNDVKSAQDGLNSALKAQRDAQEAINDALKAQRDAYQDVGDAAREVDRARADGARAIADAIAAQAQALDQVNSQQVKVDAAFDKLGLSGQKFALFLFALKEDFRAFRDDIQDVLLPSVQRAMEGFFESASGGKARAALVTLADSFGRITLALSQSLQGAAWTGFFEMLGTLGPKIQDAYGGAFVKFLEAMASIMTTLAPFALQFAKGFERLMTAFADWAASKAGRDALTRFMEAMKKIGPDVLAFFGALSDAFVAIVVALAPWGDVVLKVLTGFLNMIAGMDSTTLAILLTLSVVLIAASQAAFGMMSILLSLTTLFPALGAALAPLILAMAPWILGIGLVIAAFAILYYKVDWFRAFVDGAVKMIGKAFTWLWEEAIKPALDATGKAFVWLWKVAIKPALTAIGKAFKWLWENAIKPALSAIGSFLKATFKVMEWAWDNILWPVLKLIGKIFWNLWKGVFKVALVLLMALFKVVFLALKWVWENVTWPVLKAIGKGFKGLFDGIKWIWDKVLKPVFDAIADKALPKLKGAFETVVGAIKSIWEGLKKIIGAPIKFVLETIINKGLIGGFNKIANWVGMDGFDPIPIPASIQKYARGGIMPGYTPGRDTHTFVSPTGGRLDLSGGEAVMRPEWTQAMGPGYVNEMNAIAAGGGSSAVRKAMGMGGYYLGGVLPVPGASVARHTSGYRGYAADMNYGGGYDDYGREIKAWKDGIIAQMNYIGDASYGRWVVMNHAGNQSSLYAHMSRFGDEKVGQKVSAGQTIGYVGDIGNTGIPPTSHLHFEINGGAVDYADSSGLDGSGGGGRGIPSWLMGLVKDPLGAVKGWVTDPIKKAASHLADSRIFGAVTRTPLLLAQKATDKVWDVIPGWVKTAAGWAGDAAGWAVGGVKNAAGAIGDAAQGVAGGVKDGAGAVADFLGFADGGILPYNGTMKYDNGGYLPPGLTTVMNLTGRPEPVFTNDQFVNMENNGGGVHYEPHFNGSNLTSEDIAGDLNFTFRRIGRGGKYEGAGSQ